MKKRILPRILFTLVAVTALVGREAIAQEGPAASSELENIPTVTVLDLLPSDVLAPESLGHGPEADTTTHDAPEADTATAPEQAAVTVPVNEEPASPKRKAHFWSLNPRQSLPVTESETPAEQLARENASLRSQLAALEAQRRLELKSNQEAAKRALQAEETLRKAHERQNRLERELQSLKALLAQKEAEVATLKKRRAWDQVPPSREIPSISGAAAPEEQRKESEGEQREVEALKKKEAEVSRQVAALRERLEASERMISELRRTVAEQTAALNARDKQIASLQRDLVLIRQPKSAVAAKADLEDLRSKQQTLQRQIDELQQAARQRSKTIEELRQQNVELKNNLAEAEKWQARATAAETQRETIAKKLVTLRKELEQKNKTLEQRAKETADMMAETRSLREQLAQLAAQGAQERKQAELVRDLQKIVADKDRKIAQLEKELQEIRKSFSQTSRQADRVNQLEATEVFLRKQISGFTDQLAALREQAQNTEAQLAELRQQLAQKEADLAAVKTAALEKDTQIEGLKKELEQARTTHAEERLAAKRQARIAKLEADLSQRNAMIVEKEEELKRLRKETEQVRLQAAQSETQLRSMMAADVRRLTDALDERDCQYAEVKSAHAELVKKFESAQQELLSAKKELSALKSQARSQEAELRERQERITSLAQDVAKLKAKRIAEEEKALDRAEAKLREVIAVRDQLQRQLAELQQAREADVKVLEALRQQLAEAEKKVAAVLQTDADKTQRLAENEKQIEALRAELAAARQQAQQTELELRRQSETELKEASEAYDRLKRQLEESIAADTQKAVALEGMQAQIATLQEEMGRLRSVAEEKDKALNEQIATAQNLERSLAEARTQISALQTAQQSLKQNLEAQLQQAMSARDELRRELINYKSAVQENKATIAKLLQQIADREEETADLRGRLEEQERTLTQLRQTASSDDFRQEIAALKAQTQQDAETIAKQKEQMAEMLKIVSALKNEAAAKGRAFEEKKQEIAALRTELESARRELEKTQRAAQELAETTDLKTTLQEKELARLRELTNELAVVKAAEARARQQVAELGKQIFDQHAEIQKLQRALTTKESLLTAKERELSALRQAPVPSRAITQAVPASVSSTVSVSKAARRAEHGRKAAELVKQGRYREAEREYLALLQLDPNDADVHYNLGILYDDKLGDKAGAAAHYREYLRLRPNAPDAAAVRKWLVAVETVVSR